jgi:hypothetical protein
MTKTVSRSVLKLLDGAAQTIIGSTRRVLNDFVKRGVQTDDDIASLSYRRLGCSPIVVLSMQTGASGIDYLRLRIHSNLSSDICEARKSRNRKPLIEIPDLEVVNNHRQRQQRPTSPSKLGMELLIELFKL